MPRRITVTELTGLKPKEANFVIEFTKDFAPRRAAEASGFAGDTGYTLLKREDIAQAIDNILESRLEASHIDAEWMLMESVDNHMIARQQGNISASNTALKMVGKHTFVDAFAAEKVNVTDDREIMERLIRGRKRLSDTDDSEKKPDDEVSFF